MPSGFGRPIGATIDHYYFAMGCFVFLTIQHFPEFFIVFYDDPQILVHDMYIKLLLCDIIKFVFFIILFVIKIIMVILLVVLVRRLLLITCHVIM